MIPQLLDVAMIALAALCGAILWRKRRLLRPVPGTGCIEVVERRVLDARRALYLVRVGERFALLGASEAGLGVLAGSALDDGDLARRLAPPAREGAAP